MCDVQFWHGSKPIYLFFWITAPYRRSVRLTLLFQTPETKSLECSCDNPTRFLRHLLFSLSEEKELNITAENPLEQYLHSLFTSVRSAIAIFSEFGSELPDVQASGRRHFWKTGAKFFVTKLNFTFYLSFYLPFCSRQVISDSSLSKKKDSFVSHEAH